jgi:hypothetical protein
MKITFESTPEQLELIKAMGSKDKVKSIQAQEAFATLLSPRIGEVFNQADTTSLLYKTLTFNEDEDPSFPLEIFTDVPEGYFTVWSSPMPGGLPTNTVHQPINEVKFTIYRLDSAVSYLKKYARKTRLDVVGRAIERLMQEVMVKNQDNAWAVVLAALANAKNNNKPNVYRTGTAGQLSLDDFNKLLTYFRRLNVSWAGGTPIGGSNKATDMFCSSEVVENLRGMSYNPINTSGAKGNVASNGDVVVLPDAERAKIFATANAPEFFGINIVELLELGKGNSYNLLFDQFSSGNINKLGTTSGGSAFNGANDDLVIILDASKDFAHKALSVSEDRNSTFTLGADDQFASRADKIGFYGHVDIGYLVTQTKPIAGLCV